MKTGIFCGVKKPARTRLSPSCSGLFVSSAFDRILCSWRQTFMLLREMGLTLSCWNRFPDFMSSSSMTGDLKIWKINKETIDWFIMPIKSVWMVIPWGRKKHHNLIITSAPLCSDCSGRCWMTRWDNRIQLNERRFASIKNWAEKVVIKTGKVGKQNPILVVTKSLVLGG